MATLPSLIYVHKVGVLNEKRCKTCKNGYELNSNYKCKKKLNKILTDNEIIDLLHRNENISNMYDSDIVFDFFSRSDDMMFPGEGKGETIKPVYVKRYEALHKIPEWRKKLSNFWIAPFVIDGLTWASVEHYYQACHFKKNNPEFYIQFSLDSNTELSKDPAFAKKAAQKKVTKYKGVFVRDKGMKIDDDFYTTDRHRIAMFNALYGKFTQNEDLKYLLLCTHEAKLNHTVIYTDRKDETIVMNELMIVRSILSALYSEIRVT
jgi:predicted NAD-dependent protein-ADP-ribosyltransferase YbiA (DUF1768 family)